MLSGISREPDFVAWQIVDGSGKVVLSDTPSPRKLAVPTTSELTLVKVSENQEFWIAPMRMRDGVHPWQFRLGYTTKAIRAQLGTTIATNALIGLGLAVVFIGTSLLLTHRLLRPLHSLTSAVSELERGNVNVSLPEPGSDEIGLLVTGFSAMVASIQERDAKIQEHLGSLEAGLEFIEQSVSTLAPGGVAVHTTEFNLSSDEDTVETGPVVVYRERDVRALKERLEAAGHQVAAFDFSQGDGLLDKYVDVPPYGEEPVLRFLHGSYTLTSIAIVVRARPS